ncbi:myeloid cell surface antigen CD33 [Embiotoca jacksoni]|uniref:myeloid cell surface antigen CD33 n=1 Tax=Embiotoca jacksoni TaxID=100190 RepID=UPI003704BF9F
MDKARNTMTFCLLLAATCSPVFSEDWKATVVKQIPALVGSCVVVPCSYTHPGKTLPNSRLRGIWHRKEPQDQLIYHEDNTRVLDDFKDRTKLLGHLNQNNCTLEINDVKAHDNGPFCFRIELVHTEKNEPTKDMFSFVEECVHLNMIIDTPVPELSHPKTAIQGQPYTVTCSVSHTCPSYLPKVTWNRESSGVRMRHKDNQFGNWETESILTIIPEKEDDHTEVICTVEFSNGKKSSSTLTLYVKRIENYNHIIIPAVVTIGIAVIFGLLCIFMVKKYRKRIAELQSQDGSMWNRLSRLSHRIRSDGPGPSRSDQRGAIWSRFSRRPRGDRLDIGHVSNNVNSSCADQKLSKPRFPSPKSQAKSSYNYKEDLDDGNVYGNI